MKTISNELAAAIKPLEMKLKLMWFGVFPVSGIYIFIAWKQASEERGTAIVSNQMLPIAVVLGLMVLLQSFVCRWFTLSPHGLVKVVSGKQPAWLKRIANPESPQAKAALKQEHIDALEGDELKLYQYSGCLMSAVLIQWGLVNTCALFGMMLPPVQCQPAGAIVAGVLSATCMLFHFPNIGSAFASGLELAEFEKGMNREQDG
ncbi:hypothetical protein [Pontiella sulfatireligans]|uniref:Uncharacterized protein n=1 Tax=Pontiella sulfatireligans TaxID=2750658 RepID=A0A6C2ULF8_9BACT|nr:hypothetical protein [Pontiella sulfatireligans]VGO21082.1 hypothetical protein SCARR_03151 [Pontiella sulfatireligans]